MVQRQMESRNRVLKLDSIQKITILTITIIIIAVTIMLYNQYDCFQRTVYWNDKGIFVHIRDYQWQQCQYDEIPQEDIT